jgi:hypothetical protein
MSSRASALDRRDLERTHGLGVLGLDIETVDTQMH